MLIAVHVSLLLIPSHITNQRARATQKAKNQDFIILILLLVHSASTWSYYDVDTTVLAVQLRPDDRMPEADITSISTQSSFG
jgi:hypothetical protein